MIKNEISKKIWKDRYQYNNETTKGTIERVAKFCSNNGKEYEDFLDIMKRKLFMPAGRIMTNAGRNKKLTMNNCFVANSVPDSIEGIFDYVKLGAQTHRAGGGIGYDFSEIRPNGTKTSNDAIASGVVSFMKVFDTQTSTILQGNRRGANMSMLNIYHPDIYEYLEAKSQDENSLKHFNLSIMVDDDFMNAVNNNEETFLHYPVYDKEKNIINDSNKWQISKKVNARELWDLIMLKAYNTGEYGVLFYDNLNNDNNLWYAEKIVTSNPCAEYVSGEVFIDKSQEYMGACNLGSLLLHNFVTNPFTKNATIDYKLLTHTIRKAVRLLDNVIDKNYYPYKAYENYQKTFRTIGLGVTGLADMLTMLGINYGSKKSIELTNLIMNEIAYSAYLESIVLAGEKDSFKMLDKEKFIQSNYLKKHIEYDDSWKEISNLILKQGIRNARILAVAPTGTMSLVYGENCSSGIEPIFMLEIDRKIKIGGQSDENIQEIKLRDCAYELAKSLPQKIDYSVFKTIKNLSVDDHLNILKTVAFHVDGSVSKTINLPEDYSFKDTKEVYKKVWNYGIKGCTIFRPNPLRQGIFNTKKNNKGKENNIKIEWGTTIEANDDLIGKKRKIISGCGSLHVLAYFDPCDGNLMEVYLSKGSDGGCISFMTGLSRIMSAGLRTGLDFNYLIDQLKSAPTCPSYIVRTKTKHDTSKGRSCPEAVSFALIDMQNEIYDKLGMDKRKVDENKIINNEMDVCPECGERTLVYEGGCNSCKVCGFTKCG